ncbi:MAG: HNH endonuclease [Yoonia sp.]|uniref:HNH endonuclease n=1 Tax=Yoonia sp. TaxID=2212373 RepID=UPI003EF3DE0C
MSWTDRCSICGGYLHATKSVSYDHILPSSKGGTGELENAQLVHPFCNTGLKGDTYPDVQA